jgi:hypothetical protein
MWDLLTRREIPQFSHTETWISLCIKAINSHSNGYINFNIISWTETETYWQPDQNAAASFIFGGILFSLGERTFHHELDFHGFSRSSWPNLWINALRYFICIKRTILQLSLFHRNHYPTKLGSLHFTQWWTHSFMSLLVTVFNLSF